MQIIYDISTTFNVNAANPDDLINAGLAIKQAKAMLPRDTTTMKTNVVTKSLADRMAMRDFMRCKVCGRQDTSPAIALEHQNNCGKKKFTCIRCGDDFATQEELTKHYSQFGLAANGKDYLDKPAPKKQTIVPTVNYKPGAKKPFLCSECGQAFKSQKALNRHFRALGMPAIQGRPRKVS